MKTNKQKYETLQVELTAIEKATGLYLADPGVDRENIDPALVKTDWTPTYWAAMYATAANSAGLRAEDKGYDINELIGRVIY